MWARFGVVAFSVCRHVGDVAHSTSHEPTRSGMEPDVKKFVDFLVWVRLGGVGWACRPSPRNVAGTNLQCGCAVDQRPTHAKSLISIDPVFGMDHG